MNHIFLAQICSVYVLKWACDEYVFITFELTQICACTSIHSIVFSASFSFICFLFIIIGISKAAWDAIKYIEKEKKRNEANKERIAWTTVCRNSTGLLNSEPTFLIFF